MKGSRIYAIGDVHGRSDLLARLLDFISEDAARHDAEPQVMFLGDIVDRGPDSRGALDLVAGALDRWPASRLLLGNHDQWFLEALLEPGHVESGWLIQGGTETLASYAPGQPPESALRRVLEEHPRHLDLLRAASTIETAGDFAFVHAGIDPARPVGDQDVHDCLWIRQPFLAHVGRLSHIVVHGHTPQEPPRPHVTENRISLDTGAVFTGVLCVLVLDRAISTMEFQATRPDGEVAPVEPISVDRGLGTALDRR